MGAPMKGLGCDKVSISTQGSLISMYQNGSSRVLLNGKETLVFFIKRL